MICNQQLIHWGNKLQKSDCLSASQKQPELDTNGYICKQTAYYFQVLSMSSINIKIETQKVEMLFGK